MTHNLQFKQTSIYIFQVSVRFDSNSVTWDITNPFFVSSLVVFSSCVRFVYYLLSFFFDLHYFSYLALSQPFFPYSLLCVIPVPYPFFLPNSRRYAAIKSNLSPKAIPQYL